MMVSLQFGKDDPFSNLQWLRTFMSTVFSQKKILYLDKLHLIESHFIESRFIRGQL
jgi:hypothetical protein